jgi:uncharacterized protein
VRILLPPSEAKASGGHGRPLRARDASGPLAAPRAALLHALYRLVSGDGPGTAAALLLPPSVAAGAIAANAAVLDSPTTAALRRYTGVIYDALGFDALSPTAQRIAGHSTLICSGLFGVLRGDEPTPLYRLPAKAALPGVGIVGTFWRPWLQTAMPPMLGTGLVVDLRSADYASMWRPDGATASRVLTVRVLSPAPRGGYAVISYASKFAKGQLAAALVTRLAEGAPVDCVDDVVAAWQSCGGAASDTSRPGHLELRTA